MGRPSKIDLWRATANAALQAISCRTNPAIGVPRTVGSELPRICHENNCCKQLHCPLLWDLLPRSAFGVMKGE